MERSFREYCIRAKVDAPRKVRPNPIQELKTGEKPKSRMLLKWAASFKPQIIILQWHDYISQFREYGIRANVDAPRKVRPSPIQNLKMVEKQNKNKKSSKKLKWTTCLIPKVFIL